MFMKARLLATTTLLLSLLATTTLLLSLLAASADKPNIIFILILNVRRFNGSRPPA